MGNSTTSLQDVVDVISGMADVSPQANPGEYSVTTALAIAQDTMSDLIARDFNWKWNSTIAGSFLTNSWQQDYPQLGLSDVGWIEGGWWVDINGIGRPLNVGPIYSAKELNVATGRQGGPPHDVAWAYNRQLLYGTWAGAGKVYSPLLTQAPTIENGAMAFRDANNNILVLTRFGTTGTTQPVLPAKSAEFATVQDGGCVWTVASPDGQGFRLGTLPPANGPVYQVNVKYQMRAGKFTSMQQLLDPIPDDFAHHFRRGYKAGSYGYSSDAKTRSQYPQMKNEWIASMIDATQQGDREPDAFMMIPATQVVDDTYGMTRNPRDPGRPY